MNANVACNLLLGLESYIFFLPSFHAAPLEDFSSKVRILIHLTTILKLRNWLKHFLASRYKVQESGSN